MFEAMYANAIQEFQTKEIARIGRLAREGLDTKDLLGAKSGEVFGFRRQMKFRLLEIMNRIRNFGIGQVNDEIKRQSK